MPQGLPSRHDAWHASIPGLLALVLGPAPPTDAHRSGSARARLSLTSKYPTEGCALRGAPGQGGTTSNPTANRTLGVSASLISVRGLNRSLHV
mgnify:CR=1 FL=1